MSDTPPQAAFSAQPQPLLSRIGRGAEDLGAGILKGLGGNSVLGIDQAVSKIPYIGKALTTPLVGGKTSAQAISDLQNRTQAVGAMQKVGKALEGAGEFLIPGAAEEEGANALAHVLPAVKPLARIGTAALSSGFVNKTQGGGFGAGALAGGISSAVGEGLRAIAPAMTEFAQGIIRTPARRTGRTILNETRGITPTAIRKSARGVLSELNPQLDAAAVAAPGPVSLLPARQIAQQQIDRAFGQGEPRMYKGVKRLAKMVNTDLAGQPLPNAISPYQALELKRGVGKALPAGSWHPQSANAFKGPRDALYHILNEGFEKAVPEAAALNRRITALIPASKPGRQVFGHVMGPGAGAILGGYEGAMLGHRNEGNIAHTIRGGLEGAALGGLAGYAAPTALNIGARSSASPVLQRVLLPSLAGGALQLNRPQQDPDEQAGQVWARMESRSRHAGPK